MDVIIEYVNNTAQVLGYPVLVFFVLVMAWAATLAFQGLTKIVLSMQYEHQRRKDAERELDNLNSSWLMSKDEELDYSIEDKYETDVLTFTSEQLYNYKEEARYEDSSGYDQDGSALRDQQFSNSTDRVWSDWHPRHGISDR